MSGFKDWWDAVASLDITRGEKAVLTVLARHANWSDGANSRPSIETIGREASMGERAVQLALRSLECATPCGRARCNHRGLIALASPAGRYRPATYRLMLQMPHQARFDEVAMRRRSPYDATTCTGAADCSCLGCQRERRMG